ncbi:MAG: hypothetical protein ABR514_02880 [Chthoniobacterales bacterium]
MSRNFQKFCFLIYCTAATVELDLNYALAYFGLADAYRVLAITSDMPAREVFPQSKAAAEKALAIA